MSSLNLAGLDITNLLKSPTHWTFILLLYWNECAYDFMVIIRSMSFKSFGSSFVGVGKTNKRLFLSEDKRTSNSFMIPVDLAKGRKYNVKNLSMHEHLTVSLLLLSIIDAE